MQGGAVRLTRSLVGLAGAEEKTMAGTLKHLRGKHGGLDAYLDQIGFDAQWRSRLRTAMLLP